MEEGPEPHAPIERVVEQQHHEHMHAEPEHQRRATMISAVTAAVLAVLAAVGSLLSGHAANQAILLQTQASDQWAYFQSKSTKGHIYEADRKVVEKLARLNGVAKEKYDAELAEFEKEARRYDSEKADIEKGAKRLEHESAHEFHKHHDYALGIAAFQVGIVLASISILVKMRALQVSSFIAGIVGVVFVLMGLLAPSAGESVPNEGHAAAVFKIGHFDR
jgi:hypothetical protein